MKSVSEVCKIFGVTRKKLRYYEEIGLLIPTVDGGNGYWYYDEDAMQRLLLIQMFVLADYKRKRIKEILDSPEFDLAKELERVLKDLEEKQKRISGMISQVKIMKQGTEAAKGIPKPSRKIGIGSLYNKRSLKDVWEEELVEWSEMTDSERRENEKYAPLQENLIVIALLKNESIQSKAVKAAVSKYNSSFMDLYCKEDEEIRKEYDEWSDEDKSVFASLCGILVAKKYFSYTKFAKRMEEVHGPDAETFIMNALMAYGAHLSGEESIGEFREAIEEFEKEVRRSMNDGKDIRE